MPRPPVPLRSGCAVTRWPDTESLLSRTFDCILGPVEQRLSQITRRNGMLITKDGPIFVAVCPFEEKDVAKAAGFRWDPKLRRWWTGKVEAAAKLSQYAEPSIKAELEGSAARHEATLAASRAATANINIPVPAGLEYLPYQKAGIGFVVDAIESGRPIEGALNGDDMGLGKTIQAIGVANARPSIRNVLVICPASLRINWQREWEKWTAGVRQDRVGVVVGSDWTEGCNVVVINYDVVKRHLDRIHSTEWDLLVIDEAHYLKNPQAQRTQLILGAPARKASKKKAAKAAVEKIRAGFVLALTGTPIPNRPIEGWALFNRLDSKTFGSWFTYAKRYAAAYQNGFGWDTSGASNLEELQEKLRSTIMVRRLKSEVLTELPAKLRQVIELPANGAAKFAKAEMTAWENYQETLVELRAAVELAKANDDYTEFKAAVEALRKGVSAAFDETSALRHETALATLPYVIEHLKDMLENTNKVIVFAHHHDVVDAIYEAFGSEAVRLTGETSMNARQDAVDRFQNDPSVRLFIGNIKAAGVGITLTASSTVVFAELDWVPGNVTQAEDRAHRLGQLDSVLVQHLVLEGSLTAKMARTLVQKQDVLDRALDRNAPRPVLQVEAAAPIEAAATQGTSRERIEKEATTLTESQVAAIHEGLRMLAGSCDGAQEIDGMGFNKLDTRIGKSLAGQGRLSSKQAVLGQKLVNKYRRQLPVGLVEVATAKAS